MFHFACGLLIITEDLQYAQIIFFWIFVSYRQLQIQHLTPSIQVYSHSHTGKGIYLCAYDSGFNRCHVHSLHCRLRYR